MADEPKNSLKIAEGAVVCAEAILQGDITIGAGTVVHPKARILAETGPIIIGENNLIEEMATVVNRNPNNLPMIIGNNNVFEIGSSCSSLKVGDSNVLEIKSCLGAHVELGDGCSIGSCCSLMTGGTPADNTVIHSDLPRRRLARDKPTQLSQLDYLRKCLPNYHYLANKPKK